MNQLEFVKSGFHRSKILIAAGMIIVLILPLFQVIPNPATITGHPWKVELFASAFVLTLIFLYNKKTNFHSPKNFLNLLLFLSLFVLWSGVSAFWAQSWRSVAHYSLMWICYIIIFILYISFIKSEKSINSIVLPLAGTALILSAICLLDYLSITDFSSVEGTIRIRYAKYAELLLTIAPFLFASAFYSKKLKKTFFLLITGICAWVTVMLSLSKGAFIAGICGFAFLFTAVAFFSHPRFRRKLITVALIWLAVTFFIQITFTFYSTIPSTTDYITGAADKTRETSSFRIFSWKISKEMISENFIKGVGADNFGLKFNESRIVYAQKNPTDTANKLGEDFVFERAHNEFLQIFAELGITGLILFACIVSSFIFWTVQTLTFNKFKMPPLFWGSFAGLTGFFISSLFSSFSFRAMQNGIVFFLMLAVAVSQLIKINKSQPTSIKINLVNKPRLAFCLTATCLLFAFSLSNGLSQYYVYLAEQEKDKTKSEICYQTALGFNPENASAYFSKGLKLLFNKQPQESSPYFQKAIENGLGVAIVYSYLATSQTLSGDSVAAEETMKKALFIFAGSVFTRTRYAVLLEKNGNIEESEKQLSIARSFDKNQTDGWYSLLKYGVDKSAATAQFEKTIPTIPELTPQSAVYAAIDEESLRATEEEKLARFK